MPGWGYKEDNGPSIWNKDFPIGENGKRQSPINIVTENCKMTKNFPPLVTSWEPTKFLQLSNTGASWKVQASPEMTQKSSLKGGPLKYEYKLEQFHCHWGKDDKCGSEHTVDGKFYPAEIHFVHWNCDLFKNFAEAADKDKGLAVIGVFFEVGEEKNEELEKISSLMKLVSFRGQTTQITQDVSIDKFLPEDRRYWTYEGSLTTPPLYESVSWIVLKNPIKVSPAQIESFRNMYFIGADQTLEAESKIVQNYRPTQPIHDRCVNSIE